jgi:hypothetical protein
LAQNEEWGRDVAGECSPIELSDEQLAARAQHDPDAFAPLYQRYVRPIYAFCFQRLGTRELAWVPLLLRRRSRPASAQP